MNTAETIVNIKICNNHYHRYLNKSGFIFCSVCGSNLEHLGAANVSRSNCTPDSHFNDCKGGIKFCGMCGMNYSNGVDRPIEVPLKKQVDVFTSNGLLMLITELSKKLDEVKDSQTKLVTEVAKLKEATIVTGVEDEALNEPVVKPKIRMIMYSDMDNARRENNLHIEKILRGRLHEYDLSIEHVTLQHDYAMIYVTIPTGSDSLEQRFDLSGCQRAPGSSLSLKSLRNFIEGDMKYTRYIEGKQIIDINLRLQNTEPGWMERITEFLRTFDIRYKNTKIIHMNLIVDAKIKPEIELARYSDEDGVWIKNATLMPFSKEKFDDIVAKLQQLIKEMPE